MTAEPVLCGEPTYPSNKSCVLPAGHSAPNIHHAPPDPGGFCERHFSWLCQAGQGKCQREADESDAAPPVAALEDQPSSGEG